MTDKDCKEAERQGKCTGVCDQCTLFGGTPRKEFGMPYPVQEDDE